MSKQQMAYRQLSELTFDDLYVDEDDELYPHIRRALGQLGARLRRREQYLAEALHMAMDSLKRRQCNTVAVPLKHRRI